MSECEHNYEASIADEYKCRYCGDVKESHEVILYYKEWCEKYTDESANVAAKNLSLKEQLAKANEQLEEWKTPKTDWEMSQYWKREYLNVCKQLKQQHSAIRREAILETANEIQDKVRSIRVTEEHSVFVKLEPVERLIELIKRKATKIGE